MSPQKILLLLGLVAAFAFFFPRVETSGSGPISIRGKTPYERTWQVAFGPLPEEWASLNLSNHYDGVLHSTEFSGNIQSAANWWFGLVALLCGVAVFVLRWM